MEMLKNKIFQRIWVNKKVTIFVIGLTFFSLAVYGQSKVVSGKVTTLNDLRVANITVMAKKSKSHVKTDTVGEYFIVCYDKDVLVFKGKVFKTLRRKIKPTTKDSVNVKLDFIPTPSNKEIAVGYGYMSEAQMTSATSYMDNTNENFCKYTNIYELIRGRFPGVQIMGSGSDPEVIIRGINSFNSSSCALYVVDGLVVSTLSQLSPCQVKSINVLKDGASAIYGSRGANGVVIIETIKGLNN